jgi:prepilin-type N-terminal cleavage/methylation domain-containing protein
MKIFSGNRGAGQQGFTLIELLVVIAILAVLAAIAIPAYSRFFGEGNEEANAAELSHIQAAMDAMMAHHRLLTVDPNATWTDHFEDLPTVTGEELGIYTDWVLDNPTTADFEYLFPAFLRVGNGGGVNLPVSPTKCEYTWGATGLVIQYDDNGPDPNGECRRSP